MVKTTASLEVYVKAIKLNQSSTGEYSTARQRAENDKYFSFILKILAPRFRHFIRQYGLVAHWDDAEQVCAIAVHRAIEAYDPEKAQFTTFVNWQIRGELQSLRFRLMTDQRPSARKVEAVTVSLDAIVAKDGGEGVAILAGIEDEDALSRTESAASDYLARNAMRELTESYIDHLRKAGMARLERQSRAKKRANAEEGVSVRSVWRTDNSRIDPEELAELEERLEHSRLVIERRLFDIEQSADAAGESEVLRERSRQIAKRAARTMCELAGIDPRFAMMAEYHRNVEAAQSGV